MIRQPRVQIRETSTSDAGVSVPAPAHTEIATTLRCAFPSERFGPYASVAPLAIRIVGPDDAPDDAPDICLTQAENTNYLATLAVGRLVTAFRDCPCCQAAIRAVPTAATISNS